MKKLLITENQNKLYYNYKNNNIDFYFYGLNESTHNENSFSVETLKSIKTFKSRIIYCDKFLKKLGSGSSRVVFELPNGNVLKLAKNKKGLGQCEGEVDTININNPLLAKIYDWDEVDDYVVFVIMEKAEKAKTSDFKKLLNINFNEVFYQAEEWAVDSSIRKKDYRNQHKYFIKYLYGYAKAHNNSIFSDFVKNLESYIIDNDIVLFGDITRIVNWGVVNDRLVLIDYGLNDAVYSKHYI